MKVDMKDVKKDEAQNIRSCRRCSKFRVCVIVNKLDQLNQNGPEFLAWLELHKLDAVITMTELKKWIESMKMDATKMALICNEYLPMASITGPTAPPPADYKDPLTE